MPRRLITRALIAGLIAAGFMAAPRPAAAQSARYALVISGTSGGEEYAAQYRQWVDAIVKVLRERGRLDASHLLVLAEQPAPGEQKATAEVVRAVLGKLAKDLKPADQLFVMLIGHGGGQGADTKFNLVGPDLSVTDWKTLLAAVPARIAFVSTTSSSFAYLSALAGPGRVVISATNSPAQVYDTAFPDGFIQAFTAPTADLDKDGRISLWEAFQFASRQVTQHYERKFLNATEHSALDDDGDGVGRLATAATGQDGELAKMTFLEPLPSTTSADPQVQALVLQRDALTEKVEELRRLRRAMSAADFDQAFEKLIIDLATVSREIRRKIGG